MSSFRIGRILKLVVLIMIFGGLIVSAFFWWRDLPVNRVRAVTGLPVTLWNSELMFAEDHSNPFGSVSQFIFKLNEDVSHTLEMACEDGSLGKRYGRFSQSYRHFLQKNMPEDWLKEHMDRPVDCDIFYEKEDLFWRVYFQGNYFFYTLTTN